MWHYYYGRKKPAMPSSFSDNSNADAAKAPPKRCILTKEVEYFIEICIFGAPFLGIFISNKPATNLSTIEKVLVYLGVVAIFYGIWFFVLMLLNDYREKPFLWLTREKFKAFSNKYLYGVLAIIVLLAIFQLFFRYESATLGQQFVKIDRLTGKVWGMAQEGWHCFNCVEKNSQSTRKPAPVAKTPENDIEVMASENRVMNIVEFRKKYHDLGDVSDIEVAEFLHEKYYSNMPYDEFKKKFLLIE